MTPIDRIRARDEALKTLGVAKSSGARELRSAWRRLVFERHPDRNGGEDEEFMEALQAYDLLRGDADPEASVAAEAPERAATRTAMPRARRPRIATRTMSLSADVMGACRAMLSGAGWREGAGDGASPATATRSALAPSDHVPSAVERHGRSLTYLIQSEMTQGVNRIALPTALLTDSRQTRPKVIKISAARSGKGEFVLPDAVCAQTIPGARAVRIRFGAVQPEPIGAG